MRPHRLSGAPFAADHLADVLFGDPKLDEEVVLPFDLRHFDRFRIVDEGLAQSSR